MFNYLPIPYFIGFTAFTPEVPKLYWDVKSQEQRYFTLCKEFHKMVCYVNALADRINEISDDLETVINDFEAKITAQLAAQNAAISAQLAAQNAKVDQQLADLRAYIDMRFNTIAKSMMVYDVTTGDFRSSQETMRRLYSALAFDHVGNRALVSDVAANYDVAQLSTKTVYNVAWSNRDTIIIDDQSTK